MKLTLISLSLILAPVCWSEMDIEVSQSANPAARKPWHWKSPKPLADPKVAAKTSRIVGGIEVSPHSWPHEVALFIDDMYFCGGSLISNDWVLTAASCMFGAEFVEVVLGAHNIRKAEASQVTMKSTDYYCHHHWNNHSLSNDIALIRLPSPVSFNANIRAVNLPSSDPDIGTIVTLTGWGRPSDSASGISDCLRQVDVPTMSVSQCNALYGIVTDKHFCIDGTGGKATCFGDSGGPVNYHNAIIGITTFSHNRFGCEEGYPVVFTKVSAYLKWIKSKTGVTAAP